MEPQAGRRISPFRATKRSNHSLRKTTRRSRVHVQTIGTECRNKKVSAPSRRRDMSLDISFYRTSPVIRFIRAFSPPLPRPIAGGEAIPQQLSNLTGFVRSTSHFQDLYNLFPR